MKTSRLKDKLYEIIFEAETREGRLFDIVLLWVILLSVVVVVLESVSELRGRYGTIFIILEWVITVIFTIEYALRLWVTRKPIKYATSYFGIIDLMAILPTYLALAMAGSQYFVVVRALRLLRVFRILKLQHFLGEARVITEALKSSQYKIYVFVGGVCSIVLIAGTCMYLIEGPENGYTSIPTSMYWAIVTLTTVGYGDISPHTPVGQFFASLLMITGYAIIAVPTGIVTAEFTRAAMRKEDTPHRVCDNCFHESHDKDAVFCKKCGTKLP